MPDGTPGAGDTPQGPESGEEAKRRREQNIKAMLSDTVEVERQAMLPHYLKVRTTSCHALACAPRRGSAGCVHQDGHVRGARVQIREAEKLLKQPFGGVREGKPAQSTDLKRRLSAMRRFVPWGGGGNFVPAHLKALPLEEEENADEAAAEPEAEAAAVEPLPDGVEPMYVWQPGAPRCSSQDIATCTTRNRHRISPVQTLRTSRLQIRQLLCDWALRGRWWHVGEGQEGAAIRVDDMLTKFLRAHQREGLQFLFDCVTGQKGFDGRGWCAPVAMPAGTRAMQRTPVPRWLGFVASVGRIRADMQLA